MSSLEPVLPTDCSPSLTGRNRDLLGTLVQVRAGDRIWVQVAQSAHSYLSASDPRPLFGLGEATVYDRIDVTWPDGTREAFAGGPADRWLSLTPGSGDKATR